MSTLNIIVPCYNEKGCINAFYEGVEPFIKDKGVNYKYLFIDDGSKDTTLAEIKELRKKDKKVEYISFSRNSGKEAAMLAGLTASKDKDMVILIDADLQHPPYLIEEMLKKHEEGYKIIYTKQSTRKKENPIRRGWAKLFYSFFNRYADVPMEQSTKDFMLLDKQVVEAFLAMPDAYRFTKGIFSFVGFKRCCLEFEYVEREIGESKWNFFKLLKYGISGLNQFSNFFQIVPVLVGVVSFLVSIMSVFFYCFDIIGLDAFIVLLSVSLLFVLTNVTLYFVLYVLYSTRRETMKRPTYFVEETSLNE